MPRLHDAMNWFNKEFGDDIDEKIHHSPLSKNLIIAVAIQETYYLWHDLFRGGTPEEILTICVGDTIGEPGRTTFPRTRSELESVANGAQMFELARKELRILSETNTAYKKAYANPDKFCHGYGMFQYDLQFFKEDPNYFLNGEWKTWEGTFGKGLSEFKDKTRHMYGNIDRKLDHTESVYVAIAYNQGAKKTKQRMASRGFKQGHEDDSGVFYGEYIDKYIKILDEIL